MYKQLYKSDLHYFKFYINMTDLRLPLVYIVILQHFPYFETLHMWPP